MTGMSLERAQLEHSDTILNAHASGTCTFPDRCVIHNMSEHPLRAYPQSWMTRLHSMERVCPHGQVHPDPDSVFYVEMTRGKVPADLARAHPCDGCCTQSGSFELPSPDCRWGYTNRQLNELFGDDLPAFSKWMYGQTMTICEGRSYNHDTKEYEVACDGVAHGIVVYPWDVERYILGLPVID